MGNNNKKTSNKKIADQINTDFNNEIVTTQAIIYYPFKFNPKSNCERTIEIEAVQEGAIEFDDLIQFAGSNHNDNDRYSRSLYSLGLIENPQEVIKKYKYYPSLKINPNNVKNKQLNAFITLINDQIGATTNELERKRKKFNINLPVLTPIFNRINVVIYNETGVGFIELYLNNVHEDVNDLSTLVVRAEDMGAYAADLKKIFYNDNNKIPSYEINEFNIKRNSAIENSQKIFVDFINSVKINEEINVGSDCLLFNCQKNKKRAYSFLTLFLSQDKFKKFKLNTLPTKVIEEDYYKIMLALGRGHSSDERELNYQFVKDYLHEDENSIKYCVTNVSYGALIRYTDFKNFNYYTQHVEEQSKLIYEICIHQRMYLYKIVEEYRKSSGTNYYKLKEDFDEKMTRYNFSLLSEVEPQYVYEKIRNQLHINELVEDAKNALETKLSVKERQKNSIATILTAIFFILGIFGTTSSINGWHEEVFGNKLSVWFLCIFTIVLFIVTIVAYLLQNKAKKDKK